MRGEAALAEIQANLQLGRTQQALARLEELGTDDFATLPRPAEGRLLRAELRARAGECERAIADFDLVIGSPLGPSEQERALYGRAACRASLGNVEGSRRDLMGYLSRFPNGQFADAARRGLGAQR